MDDNGRPDAAARHRYQFAGKVFTDSRIHHAPDCAVARRRHITFVMGLSEPIILSDTDKLAVLCRLDQFRQWHSLDDKRFCLVCGRIINGRQIKVAGGTRGNGPLRLNCPTGQCNSIPMDWVLPTDEILAKAQAAAVQEPEAPPSTPTTPSAEDSLASRLRKFAVHFKLAS
jgi:hypothetical protein